MNPAPLNETPTSPSLWARAWSAETSSGRRAASWLPVLLLALAVLLVYSNSLQGAWVYDDTNDILANPSIRRLWPLKSVFYLPGQGFTTRPITYLTFAFNFATGAYNPLHYHLTNLAIHLAASLAFLGVLRRTLSLPALRERFAEDAQTLAFLTALLWALHPLLTESVSYVTQRYESLMGMFVFLTFYCVLRRESSPSPWKWSLLASLSCLLALGSKEVAISLPILILLFDFLFLSNDPKETWRKRKYLYLGLLMAWAIFLPLQLFTQRRIFAGFGLTLPWWRYALNQPGVILHYIRISLWPNPLNFDYFWPTSSSWQHLAPSILVVLAAMGATLWGLFRKARIAFLPICFFMILAPTSSIMPILDLAVEHRMYLPLAPLVVLVTFTFHHLTRSLRTREGLSHRAYRLGTAVLVALVLSAFGCLTYLRNEDYRSPLDLWQQTVAHSPKNPRAHHNFAIALAERGNLEKARDHYEQSIRLAPQVPLFLSNYGMLLSRMGKHEEALQQLRIAVQLEPTEYRHFVNMGLVLWRKGSMDSAIICFREAAKIDPSAALPQAVLADILLAKGQDREAREAILRALQLDPYHARSHYLLGLLHLKSGDIPQALAEFQIAIHLDTNPQKLAHDAGWALHQRGMDKEGTTLLRRAMALDPETPQYRSHLAWVLATSPDPSVRNGAEALALSQKLVQSTPQPAAAYLDLLGVALAESDRFPEAQEVTLKALTLSEVDTNWRRDMEKRLTLYRNRQPYRFYPDVPRS